MKHHKTRGQAKGRPKTKPVKKRVRTRCADNCASATFEVRHDGGPGYIRICNKCWDRVRVLTGADKVIETTKGVGNSHRDKEKIKADSKAYREKKLDAKLNRLMTDVFGA